MRRFWRRHSVEVSDSSCDLSVVLQFHSYVACAMRGQVTFLLYINIGVEIDGKNDNFKRPILILKKFSDEIILAVPLTTKKHEGDWYYNFTFNDIEQYIKLIKK